MHRDLNTWTGIVALLIAAVSGRLMWLAECTLQKRNVLGWNLIPEAAIALCMGIFVAPGISEYLGLGDTATLGLASVMSYFGPRGTQIILSKVLKTKEHPENEKH